MAVRIRFRVTERADLFYSETAKRITFAALDDTAIAPDDRLCLGAPSLSFTAVCDNPVALALLELGGEFYFDITLVEG